MSRQLYTCAYPILRFLQFGCGGQNAPMCRQSPSARLLASVLGAVCAAATLIVLAGCAPLGVASAGVSGRISAVGSTALYPLVSKAAILFEEQNPDAHIAVGLGGSIHGLAAVTSHQADIGDSDVYADPAQYPDPTLTDHLVAVIPFTMIVNPSVTGVTSLTPDQLIGIYSTGIYTNWKQLGGPDLPIVPVIRPATSGTRLTFRTYVMGGRDEIDVNHQGIALKQDSSQAVLTTVAQTKGAIGYDGLSVVNDTVKSLALSGVAATPANIEAGRYPFWGYEHMYTLGAGNAVSSAFLRFMLTPQIQALAQQLQYIPIANMGLLSGLRQSGGQSSTTALRVPIMGARDAENWSSIRHEAQV